MSHFHHCQWISPLKAVNSIQHGDKKCEHPEQVLSPTILDINNNKTRHTIEGKQRHKKIDEERNNNDASLK